MKRTRTIISMLLLIAMAVSLAGCTGARPETLDAVLEYRKAVEGEIPDDLHLTIYYMAPDILTRRPLTADDLKSFSETKVITVDSDELKQHTETLRKLEHRILKVVEEQTSVNARVCYVFELGNKNILQIVISDIGGNVFVNGLEVEDHPVFYELIEPFLTEEAHEILGF